MKKTILILIVVFLHCSCLYAQNGQVDPSKIKEDLYQIVNDISQYYAYQNEKKVDLKCLLNYYESQIQNIKSAEETVLFFEYLLDEFYDSHVMLNTNNYSSFRIYSRIYATIIKGKTIITNVWQNQINNLDQNIIGAEILKINGIDLDKVIEEFPTHCSDKKSPNVREWIVNKILSGRYSQPRILTLQFENNKIIGLDVDPLKKKPTSELLTTTNENGIGIISINNSLGNNSLVSEFDQTLETLMDTKGLIIDLRNTVDGGNSYVARGIMSRFIAESKPYQKHLIAEKYDGKTIVERSWMEYVSPRKETYKNPVVILVGRWTGSMGEGLAIGFEGMERATIVGTEMERLAGEINGFSFKNQSFGYRLSTAKLFHVNGTPREQYVPTNYVKQTTTEKDEILEKGMELMYKNIKQ